MTQETTLNTLQFEIRRRKNTKKNKKKQQPEDEKTEKSVMFHLPYLSLKVPRFDLYR